MLASTSDPDLKRVIPVESIPVSSINKSNPVCIIQTNTRDDDGYDDPNDWRSPIVEYISDGIVPLDKWEARRLKIKAAYYTMIDGLLFRYNVNRVLLLSIRQQEAERVM